MLNSDCLVSFFEELNNTKGYCIYKGIDHLKADLEGNRGDIDILVSNSKYLEVCVILEAFNFFKVASIKNKDIYIALFDGSNGYLLVDIEKSKTEKDFNEIVSRAQCLNVEGISVMYAEATVPVGSAGFKNLSYIEAIKRKSKRLLGMAPYSIGNGIFVVVVGTDGAGKSSLISYINELPFFKMLGVKSIYFGSNNFRTPYLKSVYELSLRSKFLMPLKALSAILMQFERRLRIIPALYYKALGRVVIGDRYFYDDLIYQSKLGRNGNKLKYFVINMFKKTQAVPDVVIYLDVDPDVAYSRKQDFELKDMYALNKHYKEIMADTNALFVDANRCEDDVRKTVLGVIIERLKI